MKVDAILVIVFSINLNACLTRGAFPSSKPPALRTFPAPSKGEVKEAIEIVEAYFPRQKPSSNPPWISWGVPSRDLDGTKYTTVSGGKGIFEKSVPEQRAAFMELSRLYGCTQALEMTRTAPIILAFNKNYFAPSLTELIKIFGDNEARAMVRRNPGLLALKPYGPGSAETCNDQTMQFSYIIAITRPYGRVLLYGLLGLLCIPAIKMATGIAIHTIKFP